MKPARAEITMAFLAPAAKANAQYKTKAFQGFSEQECATLDQGRALIRLASSARSLSLAAPRAFADEIRNRARTLSANHIGEVVMVVLAGTSASCSLEDLAGILPIM
jgi:hypothetical protein